MKEYQIFCEQDFDVMVKAHTKYFIDCKRQGKKFQKLKIISKRYVKSKTPPQHRTYWACIGELKKAFLEAGYRFDEEELHYLVKKKSGFTKMIELPDGSREMITKSIADDSDDVNIINIGHLIDFIVEYAALNLNYEIKLEDHK